MQKIMIIEDEERVRLGIKYLLQAEGYETIEAVNGEAALKILEKNIPDLIISDITMPKIDGYNLLEKVQENPATSGIPFIFLTARVENTEMRKGMNLGADDYILKPFKAKDLLSSISKRMEKKKQSALNVKEEIIKLLHLVSHEVKTPLVSILGYSDIMLDEYQSIERNELREMLERIKGSGRKLHSRIDKFLRFAELALIQHMQQHDLISVPITQYVDRVIKVRCIELASRANRKNDLVFNLTEADLQVDERHLKILIDEILDNAFQFSNKGTPITISSYISYDNLFIEFEDKGSGISPSQVNRIKNLGRSSDYYKEMEVNNGIGCLIMQKLVEVYNGSLSFESEPDEFTRVKVNFPLLKEMNELN